MLPTDNQYIELVRVDLATAAASVTLLDEDERRRARGFLRAEDRRRFVVAHTALRQVLARASGLDPAELRLARRPGGKPWLPTLPSLDFNLSHAGEVALIALSRSTRLGVDVEMLARGADWRGIAEHYFNADERRAIGDGDRAARRFYALWTAKEAVLKAIGCGLDGLREAAIALDADERPRLVAPSLGAWHLRILPTLGHPAALAHDGPPRALRHWRWTAGATDDFPTWNRT